MTYNLEFTREKFSVEATLKEEGLRTHFTLTNGDVLTFLYFDDVKRRKGTLDYRVVLARKNEVLYNGLKMPLGLAIKLIKERVQVEEI